MHVILVGHDIGGDYVSYATDVHRSKASKTIFIDAAMLKNGKSVLDIFTMQVWLLISWPSNYYSNSMNMTN